MTEIVKCTAIGFAAVAGFVGTELAIIHLCHKYKLFRKITIWLLGTVAIGAMSYFFGLMIFQAMAN